MCALRHLKSFSKEGNMQQQPTIKDVADQLEQLLIRIMLAVLFRLTDEIAGFNSDSEDEVKF
jgi:hypothetical protein